MKVQGVCLNRPEVAAEKRAEHVGLASLQEEIDDIIDVQSDGPC